MLIIIISTSSSTKQKKIIFLFFDDTYFNQIIIHHLIQNMQFIYYLSIMRMHAITAVAIQLSVTTPIRHDDAYKLKQSTLVARLTSFDLAACLPVLIMLCARKDRNDCHELKQTKLCILGRRRRTAAVLIIIITLMCRRALSSFSMQIGTINYTN